MGQRYMCGLEMCCCWPGCWKTHRHLCGVVLGLDWQYLYQSSVLLGELFIYLFTYLLIYLFIYLFIMYFKFKFKAGPHFVQ